MCKTILLWKEVWQVCAGKHRKRRNYTTKWVIIVIFYFQLFAITSIVIDRPNKQSKLIEIIKVIW